MDLTNQFLIAMPSLADPNFHRTVTLMCAHSEDGAMGIVINRPLDIKFTAVLDQMSIRPTTGDAARIPVLQGGPARAIVALGYAGWGAGQLEHEMRQNAWLSGPADSRIIFDTPYEDRWTSAARLLGIDPDHLSGSAGHA